MTGVLPIQGLVGALSPEAFATIVTTAEPMLATVDLSTVSGVSFAVRKPDGTTATWTGAIVNPPAPTASAIEVAHPYLNGDLDQVGCYSVVVVLTVPGGTVRATRELRVTNPLDGCAC